MIKFDYSNMMADNIGGEHGLSRGDLEAMAGRASRAHAGVMAKKESGAIGFLGLPYDDSLVAAIRETADRVAAGCDTFVVLGIGGSALGSIALHTALNHPYYNLLPGEGRGGRPRVFVPDNIDPDRFHGLLSTLDLESTIFNVITKSGSTAETMSQFMIVREMLERELGKEGAAKRIIATTDREKGSLRKAADEEGYATLPIPANVGGRFSVLSAVGLLSAAVSGIDIGELLTGARTMNARCSAPGIDDNPALAGAVLHYLSCTRKGKVMLVMMPYSHRLKDVADWFRQLWAESLGKKYSTAGKVVHTGQTPIKAVGATDQHSQIQLYVAGPNDKAVCFLAVEKYGSRVDIPASSGGEEDLGYLEGKSLNELIHAEMRATALTLMKNSRPNCTITLPRIDARSVGGLLFMLELQTAYAGELYEIDAFDQPGVEEGKQFTYGLMGRHGYEEKRAELDDLEKGTTTFSV